MTLVQFEIPSSAKFMDLVPELQRLTLSRECMLGEMKVHVSGEDEYLVRKAVGYLEHHGVVASFYQDICCAGKPIHELCPNCLDEYETYQESRRF